MSSDDRPVLVGMNNPYGSDPYYALYPLPERATGHRVWRMLADERPRCGMSEYREAFDRRNLLSGPWVDREARPTAEAMRAALAGRTVVLFGAKVRAAFGMPATPCGSRATQNLADGDGSREPPFTNWHWVPHPSGLCQWYNEPGNRKRVGRLLARLLDGERGVLHV